LETYEEVDKNIKDNNKSFMEVYNSYVNYLKRVEMEKIGEVPDNHFSIYSHMTRQPFTVEEFKKSIEGTGFDPKNWSIDQLEEFFFVPKPHPFSLQLYANNMIAYRTLKKLGYNGLQQQKLLKTHTVSIGEVTLEQLTPNPAPFHTFEEPVIIKESPSYVDESD